MLLANLTFGPLFGPFFDNAYYSWRQTDGPEMIGSTGIDSDSDFVGWMVAQEVSKD